MKLSATTLQTADVFSAQTSILNISLKSDDGFLIER